MLFCVCTSILLLQTHCSSSDEKKTRLPKQCDGKRKRPLNLEILAQLEKIKNLEATTEKAEKTETKVVENQQKEAAITLPETITIPQPVIPFPLTSVINVAVQEPIIKNNTPTNIPTVPKIPATPAPLSNMDRLDKTFSMENLKNIGTKIKNLFEPEKATETENSTAIKKTQPTVQPPNDAATVLKESKELDFIVFQAIQDGVSPDLAIAEYKKSKQPQNTSDKIQENPYKKPDITTKDGRKVVDFTAAGKTNNENDVNRQKKNKGFFGIFGF